MSVRYTVNDLIYLMQRLRDPEHGCPWDLQQSFASIIPHTLEEAYEVTDAIERQDWPHVEDELGDLLFQVIFYAQLGQEQQHFDFHSVVDQLVRKLVRRHPHVFPDGQLHTEPGTVVLSEAQIQAHWEHIKQQEREAKSHTGVLDDVPMSLPALSRAEKLQKRAAQVGFDWPETLQVLDKIEEEIAELREAIQSGQPEAVLDEMGDLLFAQVNLARHVGIKSEMALRSTNQKFERRFGYIESQVAGSGKDWAHYTLAELDQLWDEAKQKGL